MKLLYFSLVISVMVSCRPSQKKTQTEVTSTFVMVHGLEYRLIRDDLYIDPNRKLYLKSINNEDIENGTQHDVWLHEVYCDTCFTPTENGFEDITTLNDFVDTSSFHFVKTDTIQGASIYEDKGHKYFHKWMADGGTLALFEK